MQTINIHKRPDIENSLANKPSHVTLGNTLLQQDRILPNSSVLPITTNRHISIPDLHKRHCRPGDVKIYCYVVDVKE